MQKIHINIISLASVIEEMQLMGSKNRHSSYQTDFVKIGIFFSFLAERQREKIPYMNVCVHILHLLGMT